MESRAALAADSWNKVCEKQCTAEDMDFLYEKLSVTCPIILGKVPMPKIDEALLLDPTYPGQCACDGKIASIKSRAGEAWSACAPPQHVDVPQGQCIKCGRRYLGNWSFHTII